MTEEIEETKEVKVEPNRVLTFWLPAVALGLVFAAMFGGLLWWWMTPYDSGDAGSIIWHKKVKKTTATTTSTTDLNTDLNSVDAKLQSLDSAANTSGSSVNDQQTNINLSNF